MLVWNEGWWNKYVLWYLLFIRIGCFFIVKKFGIVFYLISFLLFNCNLIGVVYFNLVVLYLLIG